MTAGVSPANGSVSSLVLVGSKLRAREELNLGEIIPVLLAHTSVMNSEDTEAKKECLNPFTKILVVDYKFFNASFIKRSTGRSAFS